MARRPADSGSQDERDEPSDARRAKTLGDGELKLVRPLEILKRLDEAPTGLTPEDLAAGLEPSCSPRTVERDLEHLRQCGLPVENHGERWRCANDAEPAAGRLSLRASELLSILIAEETLSPRQAMDAGHAIHRLRHRLEASLTPRGRRWVRNLRRIEQATLRVADAFPDHTHTMALMEEACARHRCVAMTYGPQRATPSRRIVEPHLLWRHGGNVYVMAYCRTHMAFRSFGIKHVRNAVMLDDSFTPRSEFDDDPFTYHGFGVLRGRVHDFVIELKPEVAYLAREWVWHTTQQVHELGNGGAYLTFRSAGLPQVAAWIASLGGRAQAVAPTELVSAVIQLHCRGIESHRAGNVHLDDLQLPGVSSYPPASAFTVKVRDGARPTPSLQKVRVGDK